MLKQVSNSFGVFLVGFLSPDGFDVFGMGKRNLKLFLKDIEDGNPIFSGGFHADILAIVFKQPL